MIAAVCMEDRGGMCFCGRRVSRDKAQQADLLAWCAGRVLWMSEKSAALFAQADREIRTDENFLDLAGRGEVCFVEDRPLLPVLDRLEQLVVYRWNRAYPSDRKLDLDLDRFVLTERTEFPGNSHETITREIYERRD